MGREFALALDSAEKFDELWLIARREDRLLELGSQTGAKVRTIPLDLTKKENLEAYAKILAEEKPDISLLANISGFGKFKRFADGNLQDYYDMIDLNDKAMVSLTYATLPYMQKGGRIFQVASFSSFQPVPYMSIYAASKAFVLSFSRALNAELRREGIRCMAVCPFWVKTEFFDHAVSDDSVTYYSCLYEAKDVVRRALDDMEKGKDISVYGLKAKLQCLAVKLLPHKLAMYVWLRQQKHL